MIDKDVEREVFEKDVQIKHDDDLERRRERVEIARHVIQVEADRQGLTAWEVYEELAPGFLI